MKTVRRLLYRDIVASVAFVALAFLALFFFIDFVDELDGVGKRGKTLGHVMLAAVYELPGHFYELFPIAVLIGTIYALARLAQSSEFTILRTSGLGPGRALGMLATIGALFGALTFFVGDVVTPISETQLARFRAQSTGGLRVGGAGAWLKERRSTAEGERSYAINVGGSNAAGLLDDVLIFERTCQYLRQQHCIVFHRSHHVDVGLLQIQEPIKSILILQQVAQRRENCPV